MPRCLKCNAVIPATDCENCPPTVDVKCPVCGKINLIDNEAWIRKREMMKLNATK